MREECTFVCSGDGGGGGAPTYEWSFVSLGVRYTGVGAIFLGFFSAVGLSIESRFESEMRELEIFQILESESSTIRGPFELSVGRI